jgi:hypothetical protein
MNAKLPSLETTYCIFIFISFKQNNRIVTLSMPSR